MTRLRMIHSRKRFQQILILSAGLLLGACDSSTYHRKADKEVYGILSKKSEKTLGYEKKIKIDPPQDALRQRLLEAKERPRLPCLLSTNESEKNKMPKKRGPISLVRALEIAAENSRDYQTQREDLYLSALSLTLERFDFSNRFAGILSGGARQTDGDNADTDMDATFTVTRRLQRGGRIVTSLGIDATKILRGNVDSSTLANFDFQFVQPLLRGAGKKVALEGLTQSERDVVYAVQNFARFQKVFAVRVISAFYDVLERKEIVQNEYTNYQNLTTTRRRAEALYEAGRLPEVQVGQTRQDELRARNRWVVAQQQYEATLDRFRITLGLPTDAPVELDSAELDQLRQEGLRTVNIRLEDAIPRALRTRLDYQVSRARIEDSRRKVVVARDGLKAQLDFTFTSNSQSRRPNHVVDLRLKNGQHAGRLQLGLPLDRQSERNDYREAEINLERGIRALAQIEDQIKLEVRDAVRQLNQSSESFTIQRSAVELAQRRVEGANLLLEAGRAESRDLLEAQEALVNARNALVQALVDHTVARLQFLRDTGKLRVDERSIPSDL